MKSKLTGGAFWLTCLFSIVLFLITCWSAVFQDSTPYWVESIGFFLLTYICISEFSKRIPEINAWSIGFAVILGQLIIQTAVRCLDFTGSLGSLMIAVSTVLAAILAVFCYKDKKPYTFILSYIVLSFFNIFVADMWHNFIISSM